MKYLFIGKEHIDALKYFYFLFVDGFQPKKVWSKMLLVWFDSSGIVTCQNIFAQLNSDIYRREYVTSFNVERTIKDRMDIS